MNTTKFKDEILTAKGEDRAWVTLNSLKTLWFNTGTLCNLECSNCYIESSPKNDRLVYLTESDISPYLKEIENDKLPVQLLAFTGGEPFLNPHMIPILISSLNTGFEVLVLTNAFRVLNKHKDNLLGLKAKHGDKLHLRVSLDHYTQKVHEEQRGPKSFNGAIEGLKWLSDNSFNISVAGRSIVGENTVDAIEGYQNLLNQSNVNIDLKLNDKIVIFPEMIEDENVPEITTACWDILNKSPDDQMCASERMIVKRKGQKEAVVLPCTLIAYDEQFELGTTLKNSNKDVYLNHVYCSKFCVLGGASCSSTK
jgi:MoaA/NifB/PqqE/SkfB family radical SAM enzyme